MEELYVFGSASRNEMNEKSDVDLIVKFSDKIPVEDHADFYFDFVEAIEDLLKKHVDLLTDKPIENKYLRREIEETKQIVYAAA